MNIKQAIKAVVAHQHLARDDMTAVMNDIMAGNTSDMENAAFLIGLQTKGITVDEILGGAMVMRRLVTPVKVAPSPHLIDTCGTGGTGANLFNVSTAAAIVAACAGASVAKHGNRAATSKSGSADVLEAAGVNLNLTPEQVAQTITEVGAGFMFAPAHHSAMRHVIAARKAVGVRTLFNLLGPLTNPAAAPNQLMGVYDKVWIEPLLQVFRQLGSHHVLIVHAEDGLDEISTATATHIGELKDGKTSHKLISPETLGIKPHANYKELQADSATASLAIIQAAFSGKHAAAADMIAVNSGAAIYVAGLSTDLATGVKQAQNILASGAATDKLNQLASFTRRVAS
ncbi:MAG: anthranilate phosphoribosyltransferase [Pseudohongiellaceae bacterium]